MEFQTKIVLLSFAISVVIALIVIPILKKLKVGQIERREGPQSHLKKQGTPTMGGIIMIITILLFGIFMVWNYMRSSNQSEVTIGQNLIPLISVTVGFGIIGLIDDLKKLIGKNTDGLKPAYKMLGLLVVAVGSPISMSGLVYYTTLIDENASCHLALGRGFGNRPEFNDSTIHVDFMIGTPDMRIVGTTKDGREVDIFRDGDFAL